MERLAFIAADSTTSRPCRRPAPLARVEYVHADRCPNNGGIRCPLIYRAVPPSAWAPPPPPWGSPLRPRPLRPVPRASAKRTGGSRARPAARGTPTSPAWTPTGAITADRRGRRRPRHPRLQRAEARRGHGGDGQDRPRRAHPRAEAGPAGRHHPRRQRHLLPAHRVGRRHHRRQLPHRDAAGLRQHGGPDVRPGGPGRWRSTRSSPPRASCTPGSSRSPTPTASSSASTTPREMHDLLWRLATRTLLSPESCGFLLSITRWINGYHGRRPPR